MSNVKTLTSTLGLRSNLLTIKANTSLSQTFKKIKNSQKIDLVHVVKPQVGTMAGVIAARLMGKKFIWIQSFENPPVPTFAAKMLISQADRIIVTSRKDLHKLKNFGVDKEKIRYQQ